jgi:hypothetical protein
MLAIVNGTALACGGDDWLSPSTAARTNRTAATTAPAGRSQRRSRNGSR